jgi:uroporphyrinogen-III decarboxylase
MEHLVDFTRIMHSYGKKSIIHMCGHIGNLLSEIREIQLDGIHAMTEPPVGDCYFEKALDILGEDTIIIGTLNSTVFQSQSATEDDIRAELERIYTPRIRNSRFVLWPVSDGLPTELWRFKAVGEWIEARGQS